LWASVAIALCTLATPHRALSQSASCTVNHTPPSDADRALANRRFSDAEQQYTAILAAVPTSSSAMAGQVRSLVGEGKLSDALALAIKYNAAHPNDPLLMDALGDVRFRRGEVDEAAIAFNASQKLDPCLGITHYEVARFLNLNGMYGRAQKQLEFAHQLAPQDIIISRRWAQSHAIPPTPEQMLARLKTRLLDDALDPEEREGTNAAIKSIESRQKGGCHLVTPVEHAKFPIVPISNGGAITPDSMYAAGLEASFNGKKRRLEIDTGASGLLLSKSVAKAAGLIPEVELKIGGIGDKGPAASYVTHVDDIRIGNLEFKNCVVHVAERSSTLEVDGLIGPDVFRDFLVTLDIPGREVRLDPLPRRPDDQGPQTASLDTGDQPAGDEARPLSEADRARDRYIAPEMKDWTPIFRYGHFLIFPTQIGNAPEKLFIMDTGASRGMITPDAAREVTHVGGSDMRVHGIAGEVADVKSADNVTITFAHVRQNLRDMNAYDSTLLSRSAGVEISGLIGFPTLRELVIAIDYRDNLVKVTYDPNKGFHMR
jgi:predicted aspartyl protease